MKLGILGFPVHAPAASPASADSLATLHTHDRRRVDAPLLGGVALGELAPQQLQPDLALRLRL